MKPHGFFRDSKNGPQLITWQQFWNGGGWVGDKITGGFYVIHYGIAVSFHESIAGLHYGACIPELGGRNGYFISHDSYLRGRLSDADLQRCGLLSVDDTV